MRLLLGMALLGLLATAQAEISITDAYARATPPGATVGAVYCELHSAGAEPDRLLSADASAVAGRTELHTHTVENGVARMHEVPAVDLPAGETVLFRPGGFHIMLMELKRQLTEGDSFPLMLRFERAGEIELTVPVKKLTLLHHHDHHQHGHGGQPHH